VVLAHLRAELANLRQRQLLAQPAVPVVPRRVRAGDGVEREQPDEHEREAAQRLRALGDLERVPAAMAEQRAALRSLPRAQAAGAWVEWRSHQMNQWSAG